MVKRSCLLPGVSRNRMLDISTVHIIRSSSMLRRPNWFIAAVAVLIVAATPVSGMAQKAGPRQWQNDLSPVAASDWNYGLAAHLLERAGFSGTPEEIEALARL